MNRRTIEIPAGPVVSLSVEGKTPLVEGATTTTSTFVMRFVDGKSPVPLKPIRPPVRRKRA